MIIVPLVENIEIEFVNNIYINPFELVGKHLANMTHPKKVGQNFLKTWFRFLDSNDFSTGREADPSF